MSMGWGRRLRKLEAENAHLPRAVADLTLKKQIFKEFHEENLYAERKRRCVLDAPTL